MFKRLFGRDRLANRAIVDSLYGQIVAAARQPHLYSAWNVPDTPLGRFEMVALHVYLFLHRARGVTGPMAARTLAHLEVRIHPLVVRWIRRSRHGRDGTPRRTAP